MISYFFGFLKILMSILIGTIRMVIKIILTLMAIMLFLLSPTIVVIGIVMSILLSILYLIGYFTLYQFLKFYRRLVELNKLPTDVGKNTFEKPLAYMPLKSAEDKVKKC